MQRLFTRTVKRQRSGLTLVEVLCATALAGSLLGGLLVAQAAHLRQCHQAQRQRTAIDLLDRMLERWTAGRNGIPANGEHPVPESAEWVCRVTRSDRPDAQVLQAQVARIELWEADPTKRGRGSAASVEMLVPEAPRERRR
jgi:prepilin-type N-terminal cleavage/methylation domain-containing protein